MMRSFYVQMKVICNSWYYKLKFFIVCAFVIANHVQNVTFYLDKDYYQLHDGVKLLLLSTYSSGFGFYFVQVFPVLAVLPAGFSFVMDRKNSSQFLMAARSGADIYYRSKWLAIFTSSFLVFTIPLILEMFLSVIAFPISVTADPGNVGLFQQSYINQVNAYPLSGLFIANRWLYMLLHITIFGIASGTFNVFTAALSTYYHRFPILLFLPIFLTLYLLYFVNLVLPGLNTSTNYFFYLQAFSGVDTNYLLYFLFLVGLIVVSWILFCRKARESDGIV